MWIKIQLINMTFSSIKGLAVSFTVTSGYHMSQKEKENDPTEV